MSAVLIFYAENKRRMISKPLTIYETKGAVTQKITTYTFRSRQLQVSFTVLITNIYFRQLYTSRFNLLEPEFYI